MNVPACQPSWADRPDNRAKDANPVGRQRDASEQPTALEQKKTIEQSAVGDTVALSAAQADKDVKENFTATYLG
jgi:hypothetical protein